jgi:membrane protein implicated in regulation of membrane protease activity
MADWLPWIWLALAVIFAIAEIFTLGFVIICFGIGAGAAALLAYLGFDFMWQLAAFTVVSALAVWLSRPLGNRLTRPNSHAVGGERLVGREGIVLETIDPITGHGVVRVGHERWSADPLEDRPIAAGSKILVVSVNGAHLKVRPLA